MQVQLEQMGQHSSHLPPTVASITVASYPVGRCTNYKSTAQTGSKEYMTNSTRTRYLMGNPYAAASKHGGLWRSVDRVELVSFGLQCMKSLGCCSCSPGLVPCRPCKSFQLPFIRICEFHGKLSFHRCCCFPVDYYCSTTSCAGVASGLACALVQT